MQDIYTRRYVDKLNKNSKQYRRYFNSACILYCSSILAFNGTQPSMRNRSYTCNQRKNRANAWANRLVWVNLTLNFKS